MNKNLKKLTECALFNNMDEIEINEIIRKLSAYTKSYLPGEFIYCAGVKIDYAGILLQGMIYTIHTFESGHSTIVNCITEGSLFGQSYSYSETQNNISHIKAITACDVLFIDLSYLKPSALMDTSPLRVKLLENLLYLSSCSVVRLNSKIQLLTQKSLRDKLLAFFSMMAEKNKSLEFDLAFNREELADYLFAERSSISRELSRLQRENIINIRKRHVILNETVLSPQQN